MDLISEWFDNLKSESETVWKKSITVVGVCNTHTGPSFRYASITLVFSPSNQFMIEEELSVDISKLIHDRDWYRSIIFGVFDVMLTIPMLPIRNFRITITNIDYSEIESTQIAFRLAARDAARKALREHFPNIRLT